MKAKFVDHNILTDEQKPVERIRLVGDDWFIEVTPTDDGQGLNLISSGSLGPRILVRPCAANVVEVTTEANHDRRVSAEAKRQHEVWVANERADVFNTRKRKTKTRA